MTGASRSYIDVGSRVKVEDLVKGMIVQSGNDAAVALAHSLAGSSATVGFGDFYFRDQEPWLRIWAIVLILLGATLVTLATAGLTPQKFNQTID